MYISRTVENINDTEISIEGKSFEDEKLRLLWAKNELIFRNLAEFWKPIIVNGKKYFNYMHGQIFDPGIRAIYENVQKKIVIEPRIMKPRINSLVGQIMQGKRSGRITTEGGGSAEEVSVANVILKYFEYKINEQMLLNELLFNGCVSCCPQVLWFDYAKTAYGEQIAGLTAECLRWDSFVLSKYYKDPAGEDVQSICRMVRKTIGDVIDENPDRKDAILDHYKQDQNWGAMIDNTTGLTVEDARFLYYDMLTGNEHTQLDGRILCMERLYPAKMKVDVAIAQEAETGKTIDYQIRPGTWDDARWEAWKTENKDTYVFLKPEIKVLYQTRWTREGCMLKHEMHWFQEHDDRGQPILPIAIFTPQIVDGIPTGPGADMQAQILMKAIAETEYLHNIRTGTGDIFAYKKGSVVNFEDLPTELSIGDGIVQLDSNIAGAMRDNIDFLKRTPNTTYGEYSQKISNDLDSIDLINRGMQGLHVPDQSGKAKNTEIVQAVIGYSFLVENFNKTLMRTKNIECLLIPYVFTEEETIRIKDDDTMDGQKVVINQKDTDITGKTSNVANDLTSARWKWRLVPGDDSPTAREAELKEMLIFWNTAAPTLIEADQTLGALSSVLMSMANKTAKELGKVISEKAKVQAEQMSQQQMTQMMADIEEKKSKMKTEEIKAQRSGFSFSITPTDLAAIPGLYDILVRGNYINTTENNKFQNPIKAGQQGQPEQPAQSQVPNPPERINA